MSAPVDFEQLTIGTTAVSLAVTKARVCDAATLRFGGGDIRYRFDGVAPTASYGIPGLDGETLVLSRPEAIGMRFIRSGDVDGVVYATYYQN